MMVMTPTEDIKRISRKEAHRLALEEFDRFATVCASLDADDWARPTDCTGWDVRALALHILGSAEAQASPRELIHQWASTHGQPFTLSATGPAGGNYRQGDNGEHVDIDAVELCRVFTGRTAGTGVLTNPLPL